jgi:hypothetical protein
MLMITSLNFSCNKETYSSNYKHENNNLRKECEAFMKSKVRLLIASFFILLLFVCVYSFDKTAEGKWSKASNCLQVRLSCPRSRYNIGETIKIYIVFRNIGGTSQTIKMPSLYATVNMSCNNKDFADAIGAYPRGIEKLTLSPGQTSPSYFLNACRTDYEGAGVYEFSGGIGNDEVGWKFEPLKVTVGSYISFLFWWL